MAATYRRSKARKVADRSRKREARKQARKAGTASTADAQLSSDYFTPTTPEPSPFYNFLEDWNRGILPGNDTLLKFFDTWQTSPILANDPRLSAPGKSLVADVKELGALLTRIIRERNKDELIQSFIGHLRLASRMVRRGQPSGRFTVMEDPPHRRRLRLFGRKDAQVRGEVEGRRTSAKQDIQDLIHLGQFTATSSDFRSVTIELIELLKRAIHLESSPKTKDNRPSATMPISRENWGDIQRTTITSEGGVGDLSETRRRVQRTTEHVHEMRTSGILRREEEIESEQRVPTIDIYPPASHSRQQEQRDVRETKDRYTKMEETSSLAVRPERDTEQEQHREPATGTDEIDRILNDAKGVFKKLADNEHFREAIDGIYDILIRWNVQMTSIPGTILPTEMHYDANFNAAQQDLLNLMERFASGASLRPLLQSVAQMRNETQRDYELLDFLQDWRAFLIQSTTKKEYVDNAEYMTRGRYLLERTKEYSERKFRKLFQENVDSWNQFINGWQNDKLTTELGRLVSRIVSEDLFGQAPSGSAPRGLLNIANIQASLLGDLQNVILPAILRELYELPLPHIELEQGPLKIALDNVVLPASLFTPALLDIHTSSKLRLSPHERILSLHSRLTNESVDNRWRSGIHLSLSGMKGDIKNVKFAMARVSWPRIRDKGAVDVRLGGKGMNLAMDIATDINAAQRIFHLEPVFVRVNVSRLIMKFYGIRHNTLFAIIRPYLQSVIKSRVEKMLRDRIVLAVNQIDMIANKLAKSTVVASQ